MLSSFLVLLVILPSGLGFLLATILLPFAMMAFLVLGGLAIVLGYPIFLARKSYRVFREKSKRGFSATFQSDSMVNLSDLFPSLFTKMGETKPFLPIYGLKEVGEKLWNAQRSLPPNYSIFVTKLYSQNNPDFDRDQILDLAFFYSDGALLPLKVNQSVPHLRVFSRVLNAQGFRQNLGGSGYWVFTR